MSYPGLPTFDVVPSTSQWRLNRQHPDRHSNYLWSFIASGRLTHAEDFYKFLGASKGIKIDTPPLSSHQLLMTAVVLSYVESPFLKLQLCLLLFSKSKTYFTEHL